MKDEPDFQSSRLTPTDSCHSPTTPHDPSALPAAAEQHTSSAAASESSDALIAGEPKTSLVDADLGFHLHPSPLSSHLANLALITLALVVMFWRVFFLGETFVDVDALHNQLPWGYAAGQNDYPYNRRDLTDTYITRDYFVVAAYRDGELPLWNPYTMAGHPIYADGVTRMFSPFLLFYTFLDVPLGYSVARIFELLCAAIFFYLFLIGIGRSPHGSLMGVLVFTFSAHSMLHLTGLGWWSGLMWLPLILLFVDRAAQRRSYQQAIFAGIFLAAQFFCGWMQNQIYYVGAIVLYYLFFAWRFRQAKGEGKWWQPLAWLAVTLVVGFGLAATQWLPVMELLRYSNRKIVPTEIGYIYLPPWYLLTFIFPNLFGEADDARMLTLFTGLNVSRDHILYIGIAALLPLSFCLYVFRRARRSPTSDEANPAMREVMDDDSRLRLSFLLTLAGLAFVVMMAAPIYVHVTRFIPVLQVIRVIVRVWVLLIFALAALVAFGSDWLRVAPRALLESFWRPAHRFAWAIVGLVMIAIMASYGLQRSGFAAEIEGRGKLAFLRRAANALAAQFTPPNVDILLPVILLFVTLWLAKRFAVGKLSHRIFFAALVVLLLADLFWNDRQFTKTYDRAQVFPQTAVTDLLRSLPPGRVLVAPSGMESNRRAAEMAGEEKIIAPPNTLLAYQIPAVAGKNQQFPRWYRDYAALIEPQPYLSHVVFEQSQSRFFDLLNVRYLLTHDTRVVPPNYEWLATVEGVSVYENKTALPRAFLVGNEVRVSNAKEAGNALADEQFDPQRSVVIEMPLETVHAVNIQNLSGNAEIIEDRRNRVAIATDCQTGSLLVLSDNYYPGWRATIDGKEAEIYRANLTMRAVRLPAGAHTVVFEFAPATLRIAFGISLATLAGVSVALIGIAARRRRLARNRW